MTIRILGLVLGLAWMMFSAEIGVAQRSGLGSLGSSNSGRLNARTGSSRQGNLGLQSGGQSSRRGRSPRGGPARGLGQPVGLGEPSAQPQGREFQERSFIGRDAEDVREMFRNLSRGQRRRAMMDMVVENMNEMRESRRRWRDQQRQPPSVRVQLRPAFDYPSVAVDRITLDVQTRLTTILQGRILQGRVLQGRGVAMPSVELKGRTVTLRGSVHSEHEKALAGQLVALEPGVSQVENLLVVE